MNNMSRRRFILDLACVGGVLLGAAALAVVPGQAEDKKKPRPTTTVSPTASPTGSPTPHAQKPPDVPMPGRMCPAPPKR